MAFMVAIMPWLLVFEERVALYAWSGSAKLELHLIHIRLCRSEVYRRDPTEA